MTDITVAALQLGFSNDIDANIANVTRLVREAAARGAQVVLPPELFEGEYFCRVEDEGLFANAKPVGEHKAVRAMQAGQSSKSLTIAAPRDLTEKWLMPRLAEIAAADGELRFVLLAADAGVGFRIKEATSFFNTAAVFAGLLVLMAISLVLLGFLKLFEMRALRWQNASGAVTVIESA